MHTDHKYIELTETIWPGGQAGRAVLSTSGPLCLHHILPLFDLRFATFLPLHFDLDAYATERVFNQEVVGCIPGRSYVCPSFEFSEDFDEEGCFRYDAADATQGETACTVDRLQDHLGLGVEFCLNGMDWDCLAEVLKDF